MSSKPVKSCTACKQSKLRCDAKDTFPKPCSRCQKRRSHCAVDSSFKRTPARERLARVIKELEEFKAKEDAEESVSMSTAQVDDEDHSADSQHFTEGFEDCIVNGVVLLASDVETLFMIFFEHYYLHLPILDTSQPGHVIQTSSPLLFWTILSVAARNSPDHSPWIVSINGRLSSLLDETMKRPPSSLPIIQALLYLSTWPLPVRYQPDDPSWMYCGISLISALLMRLDRPAQSKSQDRKKLDAQARTWIGLFHVSTTLSNFLGTSPLLHPQAFTISEPSTNIIPTSFAAIISIQKITAKAISVLSDVSEAVLYNKLFLLFDTDLQDVRNRFRSSWEKQVEFALLSSRLHLYAQNVVRSSSMSDSSLGPESAITMHTAFDLAIHIIDIFSSNDLVFGTTDISNSSTSSTSHTHSMLQITLPKHIFRTAVFAAFFLLKYYCSNHHQSSATTSGTTTATTITKQQKEIAKNHVSLLYTELLACSQDPLDEFARTAAVVEVLSRRNTSNSVLSSVSGTQKGNGESRDTNAASIIAEAIDEAGELRGRNRLGDGQNQSTDDANLQWLPPQSEELLDVGMDDAWNAFYGIDWGFNPLIESA